MKEFIERIKKMAKLPLMAFLCLASFSFAAIVVTLAIPLVVGGSTTAPFNVEILAVSAGTLVNATTVTDANIVAGSSAETLDTNLTNNANQPISVWLEYSCTSADNSLTKDYIDVDFDGVDSQYACDSLDTAYMYKTFNAESMAPGASATPQISYAFPITVNGYFIGDWECSTNLVTAKAC